MSDRPKWMPSEDDLYDSHAKDHYVTGWPHTDALILRTGLRAKIEALEELVPTICHWCEARVKLYPSRLSDLRPFHASSDGDRLCKAGSLHSKIAALRKEIGE